MPKKSTRTAVAGLITSMLDGKRIPTYWSVSAYESYNECPTKYALGRIIQYCLQCGSHEGKSAWFCPECGKTQPWGKRCATNKCKGTPKKRANKHCIGCGVGPKSIPAIERGIIIHAQAEQYLLGKTRGLADDLAKFKSEFANLLRRGVQPETSWTLTQTGEKCKPDDWDRAWLRVKLDAHSLEEKSRHLTIIDYKTGREKPQEHQAEVYAWVAPYYYPEVKTVSVEFWWTNTGNVTVVPVDKSGEPAEWTRKDLTMLESKWRKNATRMLTDTTFAATPGPHCGKCDYRSSYVTNGRPGPCSAWKSAL